MTQNIGAERGPLVRMSAYWSWVLTLMGMLTVYLTGRNVRVGWGFGLATQAVWLAYGLATGQPGFILSVVGFGGLYAVNLARSHRSRVRAGGPDVEQGAGLVGGQGDLDHGVAGLGAGDPPAEGELEKPRGLGRFLAPAQGL